MTPAPPWLRRVSILLQRGIQTFTDELCQFANRVGLGQEVSPFQKRRIFARHAGAVAARINDLEAGTLSREAFCQIAAHETSRHDHVSQQQVNRTACMFPYLERFAAGGSLQHAIALDLENLNNHLAQRSEERRVG